MNNYLDTILIPTGRRFDIQKAVAKAMHLAGAQGGTIHLVHVVRPCSFLGMLKAAMGHKTFPGNDLDGYLKALVELMHWKNFVERKAPGLMVRIHIKGGFSLQPLVAQVAKKEKAGVVISAGYLKCKWFLREDNISVIDHRGDSNDNIAITLFKSLSGNRKEGCVNYMTARGIQVRLSYN